MKRRLVLMLVCVMISGLLAACGQKDTAPADSGSGSEPAQSSGGGYKIGYSMPARDQFQTSMEKAIQAKAEAEGIEINILDAASDVSAQISHVQTWEADGYDAVIVGLCNNDSAADVLAAAGDMKVVFVNRQPSLDVLQDGKVVYVGTDENLYGNEQGNYLAEIFKNEGKTDVNIAMFMGELGLDNVTKRTQSAKDALAANGINATYVENTANWDRMKAMDLFSQMMNTGDVYDAVICNNDEMALGVIEAMQTNGNKEIICPVVGIDATDVGCAAVKEGTMACSVFQDPVAQGEGTILCALGLLNGTEVEGLVDNYYNIQPQLVTVENVDNFIK
ncbi:MAG: substrate-binding domain-containing protein [Oscillibacter sp.]|nr:substrate-binding domain-containing protein [Oscillibacter sp.]